ncbi:MAG: HlyD family efflux transporter periplasmic adaptor subunit [Oscillatoriophycideae cyanobacterium NC_groundwater_1537_Pr4_S-0.65um_50_18]|nr:HlyD family efflux transporter periplasmic adaptor subunit [Oscillatoriophycideae cyanobacterium NC_groundwater_1537_Pr4_S-0.65um_50_18]
MFSNSDLEPLSDVQTQDFLPPLSGWVKFGGLFVIGTIATAVAISSIAQYRVTVKAPAVIRPTGELRIVQAATAGTVVQVRVMPNQTVKQGDVIAQIDDSQLQTKRSQLQNGIRQAQLQILQIQAQIQSIETRIAAERNRGDRAVAASEAEWSQRQRDYQNQQVISTTEVAEAQASLQAAQAALNMAQVRLERYRPIAAEGALERDRLAEAELATQQQAQEVAAAEAKLQRARTALNPTDASVLMAIEQIAVEQATGDATLASLSQEREALIQQQIQLQNQLELDARELSQVQRELLKTTIRATSNGVIIKLNLRNAGQTVQPGEEIAQIVPNATQLTIKAFVPAQEISKIKVGQAAQFRISACPYPDYGTLSGTVRTISPDAITPPAQTAQEQPAARAPYYEVALEPESLVLSQGDRHCQIQVGMEGRIDIISSQDTVLRSILRKARLISDL